MNEEKRSTFKILHHVVIGSFFKAILFILWLFILILIPIVQQPYDHPYSVVFSQYIDDLLYIGFYIIGIYFLLLAISSLFIQKKIQNFFLQLLLIGLSIGSVIFLPEFIVKLVIYIGILFYLFQRFVIMKNTAPIVKFITKRTFSAKKKPLILLFLIIEMLFYFLIKTFLIDSLIPEEMKLESYAYYSWYVGDAILNTIAFLLCLILYWRKDQYHQELRKNFLWIFPAIQIYGIYTAIQFYIGDMNLLTFEVPYVVDLLLIIILAVWGLFSDIKDRIEDPHKEFDEKSIYKIILWIYTLTIFSASNQSLGIEESSAFFAFYSIGFGVLLLFNDLGKSLVKNFDIVNFNIFNFLFNNLRDSKGNLIRKKKIQRNVNNLRPNYGKEMVVSTSRIPQSYATNYCPHCGAKIAMEDQDFCQNCGGILPKN